MTWCKLTVNLLQTHQLPQSCTKPLIYTYLSVWLYVHTRIWSKGFQRHEGNKTKLRDWRAVTGLIILPKSYPNHWFFGQCDHEMWLMTSKNNREPLSCPYKPCVSFYSHLWIRIIIWKLSNQRKIVSCSPCVTLKFDRWPWKIIGLLFYATSNFVHNFKSIVESKLDLWSENTRFG